MNANAWLRLTRCALAPTMVWDWAAGALLAGVAWRAELLIPLALLLAIHMGGMIANDLADLRQDRADGRRRPLADGSLAPAAAWAALALLHGGALALAALALPAALEPTALLIGIALLYDFGGRGLRRMLGPALLATARGGSLLFVGAVEYGAAEALERVGLAAVAGYALYFLFLARFASHEETGTDARNGLTLLGMAALAPAVALFQKPFPILAAPAWLLFAALALLPAWRLRAQRAWTPELVQGLVRRALGLAPWVPAIALLAQPGGPHPAWALGGPATALLVGTLARRFPPE
jgi:4-hydroxybenzoate polyprenyltransferase